MSKTHIRTTDIEAFKAIKNELEKRGYIMQDDVHNIKNKEYKTTFVKK